jgi:signal transduction histidine kinase
MAFMGLGALAASAGLGFPQSGVSWLSFAVLLAGAAAGFALFMRRESASRPPAPAKAGMPVASGPSAKEEAVIGHELKNYLCTLKGSMLLLRPRVTGADQAIIDRIDRVVEKLESFSRGLAGTGTGRGREEPRAIRPCESALACAQTHFDTRLYAFRHAGDGAAAILTCDPGRLDRVFLNLFANAFEAGARHIETEVSRMQGRVFVRIEDDGRGCDENGLRRLFEPFFTTKGGPMRRGLGLFIVHSLVDKDGGRIAVRSKNGAGDGRTGLIFTLDFPDAEEASIPARKAGAAPAPRPSVPFSASRPVPVP